jgi:hypothetical protein
MRKITSGSVFRRCLMVPLIAASFPAAGTVIVVDSVDTNPSNLGQCTITSAFSAAHNRAPYGTCPAGTGNDAIVLPENADFVFENGVYGYAENPSAVEFVTSDIVLLGNGSTFRSTRASCTPGFPWPNYFRWFTVVQSGHLSLYEINLVGGCMVNYYPGGSILVSQASLDMQFSTIRDSYSDRDGGAIYSQSGSNLDIRDSVFTGNGIFVGGFGGAIYSDSTTSIRNSYFSNNTAGSGAAVYAGFGSMSIVNTTIEGNVSTRGAISAMGSTEISFSTISGNSGGGLEYGSNTRIISTILTGGPGGSQRETCRLGSGGVLVEDPEILGSTFSDDPSCGLATVVDRSALRMGFPGNYGGYGPTIPLLPGSIAINSSVSCAAIDGMISEDQRGSPRPSVYGQGCDAGAYEFDGADHTPPRQEFGAGNVLISFDDRVSEYTRQGQHVRDVWAPYTPIDYFGFRGITAHGLESFESLLVGNFSPALGHYNVTNDGWQFDFDPNWAVFSFTGAVVRAGSRWFVVDNGAGPIPNTGVLVFENGASIAEISAGIQIYDVSVGANGLVYVLENLQPTGPTVRWYDPQSLQSLGSFDPYVTAGITDATTVTADNVGNIYLGGSAQAPLVRLGPTGQFISQTDCVVSGNSQSCAGSISNLVFSEDNLLFVGFGGGHIIAMSADLSSGFSAPIEDFNPNNFSRAFVSPLPLDHLFDTGFEN